MKGVGLFLYAPKYSHHTFLHVWCRKMTFREPDEGQCHRLSGLNQAVEQLFVLTESLAQLTLHAIAVYGMLEPALGNANEQLCHVAARLIFVEGQKLIDGTQREGGQCMTLTAIEEFVHQLPADDTLTFCESVFFQFRLGYVWLGSSPLP